MRFKNQIEGFQCISLPQMQIILNLRDFWRKIAIWTRAYSNSRYLGIGNSDEMYNSLLILPRELTTKLELIFGKDIMDRFNDLLVQHLTIIKNIIDAQTEGNTELIKQYVNELFQNGNEIAEYLSNINPYWETTQLKPMINTFLRLLIEESNDTVTGNYQDSIKAFDRLMNHVINMSDYFSLGLFKYMNLVSPAPNETCITYDQMDTIYKIRMFWVEMATWTRAALVSKVTGPEYSGFAYERLKQVPENYGNILKTYFEEASVDEDLQVINNYIELINDLITAESNGNNDEINRIKALLFENAKKRAMLLANMNPYLNQNKMENLLYSYTQNIIDEIDTFFSNDYTSNINIYNELLNQAAYAGDYFSQALYSYRETRG